MMAFEVDLESYFARVGFAGPCSATLAVLNELHARHPASIPFEGLDPFLGRPVAIDLESIQAKLVNGERGGYCHEQNALFYAVLTAAGFRATPLGARVVWMAPGRSAPLTHRLTLVHLAEGDYLADVGFGGQSYTAALRFERDTAQVTSHGTYRITEHSGAYLVEMKLAARWEAMYRFTLDAQTQGDFEMANWFTSTHPRTRFARNLVAARVVGDSRVNLINRSLSVRALDGSVQERVLSDPDELEEVLTGMMGICLPVPAAEIWRKLPVEMVPQWP